MSKGFDITEALGMSQVFQPNYQNEYPIEFASRVGYYMERYYSFEAEPERYWPKLCAAVKWANKSIMLERLGLENVEERNPDLFKSVFNQLAAADENLMVKGDSVYVTEELRKSFDSDTYDRNAHYEKVWKAAHDTIPSL